MLQSATRTAQEKYAQQRLDFIRHAYEARRTIDALEAKLARRDFEIACLQQQLAVANAPKPKTQPSSRWLVRMAQASRSLIATMFSIL